MRPLLTIAALLAACPSTEPPAGEPTPDPRGERWGTEPLPEAGCVGDGDFALSPGELVVAADLGVRARFVVNRADSAAAVDAAALADWDFSASPGPDDVELVLGARPVEDFWFAGSFPEADYASLLDNSGGTWGIYADDGGAQLLGIASQEADETVLVYDAPVPVLPVPMELGDAWSASVQAAGVFEGTEYPRDLGANGVVSLTHRYAFEVDEVGPVLLPHGQLPALHVRGEIRTEAHNSAAGLVAADFVRLRLWVAECLGVVARLRSEPEELDPEFTVASEYLRFGVSPELQ